MTSSKSHKLGRKEKDKLRRKPVKDDYYRFKIKRKAPPQAEKKVVVRQELVKDPKTGRAEYKNVYDVNDTNNSSINSKLSKTLYIPHQAPPKPFNYLRPVKQQHISNEKRYAEPKAKYGDLSGYKKNKVLEIAKSKYDLPDKLVGKLDKDELIEFIDLKYKGVKNPENRYARTKLKLEKIEPIRKKPIKIEKSADPTRPWEKVIHYGILSGNRAVKGDINDSEFEKLNKTYPKLKTKFGTLRGFDQNVYNRFKLGKATLEEIADELATHLKLPESEKEKLPYLTPNQLQKLYNKAYKHSLKNEEDVRYKTKFYMPKFEYQRGPNFGRAPQFLDYTGRPHAVGSGVAPPVAYTKLDEGFDYQEYVKPKEVKKLEKLEDRLQHTKVGTMTLQHRQDINDLYAELLKKESQLNKAIKRGDDGTTAVLKAEIGKLENRIIKIESKAGSSSSSSAPSKQKKQSKKG